MLILFPLPIKFIGQWISPLINVDDNFLKLNNMKNILLIAICLLMFTAHSQDKKRARDYGLEIGVLKTGSLNAITDIKGVKVGHFTLMEDGVVNTGVTAIIPHSDNIFQNKVPAAIYIANGFGKLTGISQVEELGNLETPVVLTNTLSVPTASGAVIKYMLNMEGNENVKSVNPVVGETNDGRLNDIRGLHITEDHVLAAIQSAKEGKMEEGSVGAGTGTVCFGFKGGIGTSSRVLPQSMGGYTIGVLVQTNFGGVLQIDGAPVGVELGQYYMKDRLENDTDGSCMIIVATDAPLSSRNLKRMAKRAILGLGKTGGVASNGSGDYVIAFSVNHKVAIPYNPQDAIIQVEELHNDFMSPLFMATIEATEEAIINSLFTASEVPNSSIPELPVDKVLQILKKYGKIK